MKERIRIDTHAHTEASDGKHSLQSMIEKAIKEKFTVFSITNHLWYPNGNWETDLERIQEEFCHAERFIKEHATEIRVVPGAEITTSKWHLVLLGTDFDQLSRYLSHKENSFDLKNILPWAHDNGVLSIAAHPLAIRGFHSMSLKKLEEHAELLTGAEIHNGEFHRRMPHKLYELWHYEAKKQIGKLDLIPFTGSDAHRMKDIGMGTEVTVSGLIDENTPLIDILSFIRKGKNFIPIIPKK